MAWDGYRLPVFNREVVHIRWDEDGPFLFDLDLNDYPIQMAQIYWSLKRLFRVPLAWILTGPPYVPMMIKAQKDSDWQTFATTPFHFSDTAYWSWGGLVWSSDAVQVGPVALGFPNEYVGVVISPQAVDWETYGMTLPPGWPIP